jgi:hypothetical protein
LVSAAVTGTVAANIRMMNAANGTPGRRLRVFPEETIDLTSV